MATPKRTLAAIMARKQGVDLAKVDADPRITLESCSADEAPGNGVPNMPVHSIGAPISAGRLSTDERVGLCARRR
jgi:hypothetical protein